VSKGGVFEETVGRKCLCNCLLADIGLQQVQKDGSVEPGMVTTGDDLDCVLLFLPEGKENYSAAEAVTLLMSKVAVKDEIESGQALPMGAAPEQVGVLPS
jgi:nitronate monooxygenase